MLENLRPKILSLLLASSLVLSGCSGSALNSSNTNDNTANSTTETQISNSDNSSSNVANLADVPDYSGSAYIQINNNIPFYTDEQKQDTNSRIELSELDNLGRCGVALEIMDSSMFPTEKRKDISSVYPTGWHQAMYGNTAVYNRSHLLGYAESGLNDEPRNLITGTAQMNQDVMTIFENEVRNYANQTGNHIVYRVTPDFHGDELVARGVEMEAWSVEDNGSGICFNVYVYNVQNNVNIDYETGYTSSSDYVQESSSNPTSSSSYKIDATESKTFVINANNGKFHTTDCIYAQKISTGNRQEMVSTVNDMISNGYDPAGCCIK